MKLIRFGKMGREKPGVLLGDGTELGIDGLGEARQEVVAYGAGHGKDAN